MEHIDPWLLFDLWFFIWTLAWTAFILIAAAGAVIVFRRRRARTRPTAVPGPFLQGILAVFRRRRGHE